MHVSGTAEELKISESSKHSPRHRAAKEDDRLLGAFLYSEPESRANDGDISTSVVEEVEERKTELEANTQIANNMEHFQAEFTIRRRELQGKPRWTVKYENSVIVEPHAQVLDPVSCPSYRIYCYASLI